MFNFHPYNDDDYGDDDIVDYDDNPYIDGIATMNDILNFVANKPVSYIVIYANWCPHCQHMIENLKQRGLWHDTDKVWFIESENAPEELKDYYPHIYQFKYGQYQDKNVTVDDLAKNLLNF